MATFIIIIGVVIAGLLIFVFWGTTQKGQETLAEKIDYKGPVAKPINKKK